MKFSVIIPVFNRPDEIEELLESLTHQTYRDFEVLVIEDGSDRRCGHSVEKFSKQLEIKYYFKENSGQGFSRNYGYERATGDYFVVFDSDCLIPPEYFAVVKKRLESDWLDAYGGPDRADNSFTPTQKAINYAMTSLFTTGGTRGSKKSLGAYHPRSFNMGISREVFQKTGGYILTRMAEDLEFSIRIIKSGFKTGFIEEAFVYHKRRTSFASFFRQIHFFGRGRINLTRYFPEELKYIHAFPLLFTGGIILMFFLPFLYPPLFFTGIIFLFLYLVLIFLDAFQKTRILYVSLLSLFASVILLTAYGTGFAREGIKKWFQG
jgi:glycosyltransferase involved in cell wall biosynthesis